MTLSDFLMARISEDEVINRRILDRAGFATFDGEYVDQHARRLLAECEAKRAIIAWAEDQMGDNFERQKMLPLLALPYADHDDFDESWRP